MLDTTPGFETATLAELEHMDRDDLHALPFGVIGLDRKAIADVYSAREAEMSGVSPNRVMGSPFFENIGQCMNNFLVAQRFEDEEELDDIVPFVLTLRMRPTRVRLRLMQSASFDRRYILIDR